MKGEPGESLGGHQWVCRILHINSEVIIEGSIEISEYIELSIVNTE
jgi:hypothetical protein